MGAFTAPGHHSDLDPRPLTPFISAPATMPTRRFLKVLSCLEAATAPSNTPGARITAYITLGKYYLGDDISGDADGAESYHYDDSSAKFWLMKAADGHGSVEAMSLIGHRIEGRSDFTYLTRAAE